MIRCLGGRKPQIHPTSYVYPTAEVIGSVSLEKDVSIWPTAVLRGDLEPITIGEGSNIQDNSVVHTSKGLPVIVGKYVTVGHSVTLHGCKIGDRALIGMGSTLLDGSIVEDDAMVAAGAVVAPGMRVQSGQLAVGVPARMIRKINDTEKKHILKNAQEYIELKEKYLKDLKNFS